MRRLIDGVCTSSAHWLIFAQVFPDPHSKQTATIMRPFLVKVVEGGDVYNRGK